MQQNQYQIRVVYFDPALNKDAGLLVPHKSLSGAYRVGALPLKADQHVVEIYSERMCYYFFKDFPDKSVKIIQSERGYVELEKL